MSGSTVQWLTDADQALAEARRVHKPLLLDFSAAPM
jgi:ubiquinone/menaquinone biosynthesis C-methylase UbiE